MKEKGFMTEKEFEALNIEVVEYFYARGGADGAIDMINGRAKTISGRYRFKERLKQFKDNNIKSSEEGIKSKVEDIILKIIADEKSFREISKIVEKSCIKFLNSDDCPKLEEK